ncbi:MAG: nickel pincer cofactor biosynthesis protein LarB [Actinomycetota bacterium]|nr:nickel pincer cofactor biosynthesis protein LarB [Actinomycetota bacterium]
MRPDEVRALLERVRDGTISTEKALRELRQLPIEDLGFAQLDVHRELRQGMPEAIYAEGKTTHQVVEIARRLVGSTTGPVIATRVREETALALREVFPEAVHHEVARMVVVRSDAGRHGSPEPLGNIAVVAAGTSDLPVAEEAAVTAEAVGIKVERITDVGVAGLHRILAVQDALYDPACVIVVAGMEGALASLVGGISPVPVVAVPTSVGYGAAFEGLAALLAMLNSCAAGVVVTNIDNGFGAAMFALRLLGRDP